MKFKCEFIFLFIISSVIAYLYFHQSKITEYILCTKYLESVKRSETHPFFLGVYDSVEELALWITPQKYSLMQRNGQHLKDHLVQVHRCILQCQRALCMHACMLSQLSSVWLFVTLWTAACQTPLSMGFPRQEYWSGLPCPSPGDLPDQGSNPCLLHLLHWQAGCLLAPPGKPLSETLTIH